MYRNVFMLCVDCCNDENDNDNVDSDVDIDEE